MSQRSTSQMEIRQDRPSTLLGRMVKMLQRSPRPMQALAFDRAKWVETYQEMGKRLAGFGNLAELMQFAVDETKDRLKAETSALFLLEGDRLVRKAIAGLESEWFPEEDYQVGEGITGQALVAQKGLKHGKPVLTNDVDQSSIVIPSHLMKYKARLRTHEVKHLIVVPLNGYERSFGVLRVVNHLDSEDRLADAGFTEEDVDSMVAIASIVAIAIENTILLHKTTQLMSETSALNKAAQAVSYSLRAEDVLTDVLKRIVTLAGDVAESDHTGIVLVGDNGELTESVESHGLEVPLHKRARSNGITMQVVKACQPIIFDEVQEGDAAHNATIIKRGYRSYAGIPIVSAGQVRGVLFVHSFKSAAFRSRLQLLLTFCNHAAIAIENSSLFRRVGDQATMLKGLVRASSVLIQHTSIAGLLEFCANIGAEIFRVEDCSLYLRDEERQTIDLVASSSIPPHIWRKREALIKGPGLTAYVAQTGETLNFGGDEFKAHKAWAGRYESPFLGHLAYLPSKRSHSLLMGPLLDSQGNCVGVLKLENKRDDQAGKRFSDFEEAMHKAFASQVGMAIERAQLYCRLDEEARKKARESLSYDLHDIMSIAHGTLILGTEYAQQLMHRINVDDFAASSQDYAAVTGRLRAVAKAAKHIYESLGRLHKDVRDFTLENEGLIPALKNYVNMLPFAEIVRLQVTGREKLPADIEYALYRIAQEALSNIARHAELDNNGVVHIQLTKTVQDFNLVVCDNGLGFDIRAALSREDAFGYQSMCRWAEAIHARLEIFSKRGKGTRVQICGLLAH